jgi:hypothetical protein
MFYQGYFLFSYDLKSAYHHIMMHPMDITYLGFQWKSKYTNRSLVLFPATVNGLTTCGFNSTREIHPFINNLSISSETKRLLSLADLPYYDASYGYNVLRFSMEIQVLRV